MDAAVCVCGKKVSSRLLRCPYCKADIAPSAPSAGSPSTSMPGSVAPAPNADPMLGEPVDEERAATTSTLMKLGAGALLALGLALFGVGVWRASVPSKTPAGELALTSMAGEIQVDNATLEWDQKMFLITGKDGRQFSSKSPREGVDHVSYRDFVSRSTSYVGHWAHIDGAPRASYALKSIWTMRQRRYGLGPEKQQDRPSPVLVPLSDDVWVASGDVMSLDSKETTEFMSRGSYEGRVQRLRDIASNVVTGWEQLNAKFRERLHRDVPADAVVVLTGKPYEGTVSATYVPILETAGKIWVQLDGEVATSPPGSLIGSPIDVLPPEHANTPELEGMTDVLVVGKRSSTFGKVRAFGGTGALGALLAIIGIAVLLRKAAL